MNGYRLIVFSMFTFYNFAMEIEYIKLPPKNVLENIIESTFFSVYICPNQLKKLYSFAECQVPAYCLFNELEKWYDEFRFLQITNNIPINIIYQYAGYLVVRDYVFLVQTLLQKQAPVFWMSIKSNLLTELLYQKKCNWFM